jgi:flagellar biosynthesis/type III secretory pathway M-ring protein FliF/YscJ
LRKLVQSALGIQEGTESNRRDQITLEEFEFNGQPVTGLSETLRHEQRRQFWLHLMQVCLYPVLALGVLAFLWRIFKRAPDVDIPLPSPANDRMLGTPAKTSAIQTPEGVITVDVLNQLIRENPHNMTQAIRGWIGRGPQR